MRLGGIEGKREGGLVWFIWKGGLIDRSGSGLCSYVHV